MVQRLNIIVKSLLFVPKIMNTSIFRIFLHGNTLLDNSLSYHNNSAHCCYHVISI